MVFQIGSTLSIESLLSSWVCNNISWFIWSDENENLLIEKWVFPLVLLTLYLLSVNKESLLVNSVCREPDSPLIIDVPFKVYYSNFNKLSLSSLMGSNISKKLLFGINSKMNLLTLFYSLFFSRSVFKYWVTKEGYLHSLLCLMLRR